MKIYQLKYPGTTQGRPLYVSHPSFISFVIMNFAEGTMCGQLIILLRNKWK